MKVNLQEFYGRDGLRLYGSDLSRSWALTFLLYGRDLSHPVAMRL